LTFRLFLMFLAGLALLTGIPQPLTALDPAKPVASYVHDAWDMDNGLPQNSVMALLQTRDGYLWVATQEGLVRFNGKTFTPVHLSAGEGNDSKYIT